jgi:prepilin-type N-terminal cleavage/methylation domain-containing protein
MPWRQQEIALRHARRGFTLIEVLVVIGIILVLVGMLVWGFRHVNATAAHKETVVELHVLKGMLADYESHNGLAGIESTDAQVANPPASQPPAKFPVYSDVNAPATPAVVQLADLRYPPPNGASDMSDRSANQIARYTSASVGNTRDIVSILARIPSNRTLLENLPPKRILEAPPNTIPLAIAKGVVLLDGWSDPIIFVPRGGLHVLIKNPTNPSAVGTDYIVRSSGTFLANQLIKHPLTESDRPFFASAGQDSDFTTGENNVYSFQE